MSKRTASFVDSRKIQIQSERKNLNDFIKNLQSNKEAYLLFYEQAERSNLAKRSPQRKFQFEYFDNYIKPHQMASHRTLIDGVSQQSAKTRNRYQSSTLPKQSSQTTFIPLRDLLQKNHADRVQDYLKKMDSSSQNDDQQGQSTKQNHELKKSITKLYYSGNE